MIEYSIISKNDEQNILYKYYIKEKINDIKNLEGIVLHFYQFKFNTTKIQVYF